MSEYTKESKNSNEHQNENSHSQKQLYRSTTNHMIGGVAGGIGEYFAIDPTIVRLGFILLTFANGVGLLLYIVMWVIMPENSHSPHMPKEQLKFNAEEFRNTVNNGAKQLQSERAKGWWGWLLIAIGLYFIVQNFGLLDLFDVGRFWPILLVGLGAIFLVRGK